jgi:branched-chain amino acid transport system ATP-binding protein
VKIIFHPRFYEIYTHDPALKLDSINTFYGLSHILFDVCLDTNQGEVVVLLGRNGAGKSTTFRSVIGLTPPRTGKVFFKEKNITQRPSFQIARVGIGFVPEDRRIYTDLSVIENLEVAIKKHSHAGTEWTIDRIFELFPVLEKLARQRGGTLSGGEQQMLTRQ